MFLTYLLLLGLNFCWIVFIVVGRLTIVILLNLRLVIIIMILCIFLIVIVIIRFIGFIVSRFVVQVSAVDFYPCFSG